VGKRSHGKEGKKENRKRKVRKVKRKKKGEWAVDKSLAIKKKKGSKRLLLSDTLIDLVDVVDMWGDQYFNRKE
jgi:hypothetical protein